MEKNQKPDELLDETFSSNRSNRRNIIESIINNILDSSISLKTKEYELYLIVDEAVTNAMSHGNQWDGNKNLGVKVQKNDILSISIKDEGPGFNSENLDVKNRKRPGGRGIRIIKHFCAPEWNKKGNEIKLKIRIQ